MNREEKLARDLAKLDDAQRMTHERMVEAQKRVDARFEHLRSKLASKYGTPSESQQRIIEAALELLKQDGLANITLRRLARMLDMQAPALYWHFKNKEELVDHMAEAILQQEFTDLQPRTDDESWQDWLINHMLRLRKAMLAYPDGARVVAGAHLSPAVSLARLIDTSLQSLESAGLDIHTAHSVSMTATTYTFGYVIEEQSGPSEEQMAQFNLSDFMQQYPYMAKAIRGDIHNPATQDKDYITGLHYIIAGATSN